MRGKSKTISAIVESNPKYLFNWRIRRAARLAIEGRLRKRAVDDEITYRCAAFLRREKRLESTLLPQDERIKRLAAYDLEVFIVVRIIREAQFRPLKRDLKLRILAQQTETEIAVAAGLPLSVVCLFRDLAFSINKILPYRELLLGRILGKYFLSPLNELPIQQAQMLLAYELGSRHIDIVLALGERVGNLAEDKASASLRRQRFWQQHRTKLNSEMTPQLIDMPLIEQLLGLRAA